MPFARATPGACRALLALLAGALAPAALSARANVPSPSSSPSPDLNRIRWTGRVDTSAPGAVRFAWQGAGLVATVRGRELAVKLRTDGASGTIWFQPVVDGQPRPRFGVEAGADRTVVLASFGTAGDHTVELYRETEGTQPASAFLGFTSGEVRGAPPASGRRLEIVGDSISAAYGNLGVERHLPRDARRCTWSAENSSWYQSYGALAGRALRAEVSTVAVSGWGLFQDRLGRPHALGGVYEHALGVHDPTPYRFPRRPAAVIVNLGTNDEAGGFDRARYVQAGLALLARIRAHAPDAWVLFAIGPLMPPAGLHAVAEAQGAIVAEARSRGDARVESFTFAPQRIGAHGEIPTGCDWHPSAAEHQRMADALVPLLRSRLRW
jgi:lysophospholipase L1-like esterase